MRRGFGFVAFESFWLATLLCVSPAIRAQALMTQLFT